MHNEEPYSEDGIEGRVQACAHGGQIPHPFEVGDLFLREGMYR